MLSMKDKERIGEIEAKAYFEGELSEADERELTRLIAKANLPVSGGKVRVTKNKEASNEGINQHHYGATI